MAVPDIRYVQSRDGHVAYQTSGDGSLDLVLVLVLGSGSASILWEEPWSARFLQRLSSFARLITYDQRGTGRSDPIDVKRPPMVEERMEDLRAVLDATDAGKATLFGFHDGGPVALLLAASHPDRVESLVLCNTWARLPAAPDYPWGVAPELLEVGAQLYAERWGTGDSLNVLVPSMAQDPTVRQGWPRHEQLSQSPGQSAALARVIAQLDVRDVLATVRSPTLVMHTAGNLVVDVGHGRYLAEHILGARWLELAGADHLLYVSPDETAADEIEEFVTGVRRGPTFDRVLSTVLFTDIVDSTPRAAAAGDRLWSTALDAHDAAVRHELGLYRGEEVRWTGDGFLATFDGPGRAVHCAQAIVRAAARQGIEVRAGLHTGEIERRGSEISGITVHVANRVAGLAGPGEVVVSSTVRDLVAGSGLAFDSRGVHALKGIVEPKEIFAVAR